MKVKVTACKCERCNWVWLPRGYPKIRTSKKCPSCGSYYWDTPRRKPKDDFLAPKLYAKEINNRFKEDSKIRSELAKKMKPEPVAKTEPPEEDDLDTLKRDCLACTEKYKTGDGKWRCASFDYKSRCKYDRCRLCWELEEIWGEQAAGYKERNKTDKEN